MLQSSQNCTALIARHCLTRLTKLGLASRKVDMKVSSSALVLANDGHERRKHCTVPLCDWSVLQHSGREHIPSLFQGTQWPERASTLNRPDRILDCVVAFSSSHGEDLQDLNSGWHFVKPRNLVFRYCREGRVSALVLILSRVCWRTADRVIDLTWDLPNLADSHSEG